MNWVYLGKIVNTHGIKGELRILSDFEKKEKVFRQNFPIYIGKEKRKEIIATYRPHKNFDMICYRGVNNINEVLKDKGKNIYITREDLALQKNEYLLEDLISFQIMEDDKIIGKIIDIVYNKAGILLMACNLEQKKFYIPNNEAFILKIDLEQKIIWTKNAQGLIL